MYVRQNKYFSTWVSKCCESSTSLHSAWTGMARVAHKCQKISNSWSLRISDLQWFKPFSTYPLALSAWMMWLPMKSGRQCTLLASSILASTVLYITACVFSLWNRNQLHLVGAGLMWYSISIFNILQERVVSPIKKYQQSNIPFLTEHQRIFSLLNNTQQRNISFRNFKFNLSYVTQIFNQQCI